MSGPNTTQYVSIAQAPLIQGGTAALAQATLPQALPASGLLPPVGVQALPQNLSAGIPAFCGPVPAQIQPAPPPQLQQQQVSQQMSAQAVTSPTAPGQLTSPLVTQMPGQPFTGAINLTISNGAINIKPAVGGSSNQPGQPDVQSMGVIKNLPKLPLMPQQQAMNLKLPTGHIQVANISQASTMMGTRPAMVISSPQLRAGAPMLPQNVAQLNMTQAIAQVVPQGAQLLPPGTVQLPQGAKLVTQLPVAGQIGQPPLGNIPIRASIAGTLAVTSGIPMVSMGMAMPSQGMGQPVSSAAITSTGILATNNLFTGQMLPQSVAMSQAAIVSNAINLQPIGQPAVANMDSLRIEQHNTLLQQKPNGAGYKDTTSLPTSPVKENDPAKTVTPVKSDNRTCEQTKIEKDVKEEKEEADFDPANAMEWKDGVGTLPGSDLKFRINEFGVVEMITDDLEESLQCRETLETIDDRNEEKVRTDDVLRCEHCGVFGTITEFNSTGRFCSQACQDSYGKKNPPIRMTLSTDKILVTPMGMKRTKKRKFTDEGDDADAKLAKVSDDDSVCSEPRRVPVPGTKKRGFSWSQYLELEKVISAPVKLFKDPFPCTKNGFKAGMKLEGIDPRHPSLYCVLSVAEVKGYRLRLHFDGYSECFDFWTNADSPFIFPAGWAEKNGKKLQPPKGFTPDNFNWSQYLKLAKFPAAPKSLFTNTQVASVTPHGFRLGMKLEAVDKKNSSLTCVSTVADVLGDRILIHFDGWEDMYDYWCDPSSPYIHPVGWCQQTGKPLSPPNDWPDIEGFTWEDYLKTTKSAPVPARAFKTRPAHGFEVGMKLEVMDKRNPILVRAATIADVEDHQVLIHFDGWAEVYDYHVDDDDPDIHPVHWCQKTGHPLTPPITPSELASSPSQGGCPTPGCSGVGHVKGAKYTGHHSAFGCPYSPMNLNKEAILQDRLGIVKEEGPQGPGLKPAKGMAPISPEEKGKCPTPGCDGSGHITGKYTAHHRVSGCPLAEVNKIKPIPTVPKLTLKLPPNLMNGDKPLFGPGSGRGRKKAKVLKLIQKQRELEAKGKLGLSGMTTPEPMNGSASSLHQGIHQSVFMTSMLPLPSRDLPLCWEQHSKLLPGVDKHKADDVANWDVKRIRNLVAALPGCQELARSFQDEQIDGEAFLLLNQQDIVKVMNVKLGPALKIYNSILMIKNNVDV